MRARREIRSLAVLINHGAKWMWAANAIPPPFYTGKVFRNPFVEAESVPGSFWTGFGEEKIPCSRRRRTPTRPARIDSLHRLLYPGSEDRKK